MRDRACSVVLHSGHVRSPAQKIILLKEYKFKEGKKRRKTLPPSESVHQTYVDCNSCPLFGATISYHPPQNSGEYPMNALVEVSIDGRAVDVWTLNSNESLLLEDGCSQKLLERLVFSSKDNKENTDSCAVKSYFGTIDFTFWRAMKSHSENDYIPDEGLPALAIFTFHYRDDVWLRLKGDSKQKCSMQLTNEHGIKPIFSDYYRNSSIDSEFKVYSGVMTSRNRRRVPVFVFDQKKILTTSMDLNIDRNCEISILYHSLERLVRFLEQQGCIFKISSSQIVAITMDGIQLNDLCESDFDAIKEFHIIKL